MAFLGSLALEVDPTRLVDSTRVRVVHSRFSHCAVLLGIREQRKVFGLCFVTAVHAGSGVVCFQSVWCKKKKFKGFCRIQGSHISYRTGRLGVRGVEEDK